MIIPFGKYKGFDISDHITIPDGMKKCSKCNDVKHLEDFQRDNSSHANSDGHTAWCKQCRSVSQKAYYCEHKDELRARLYRWREKNPERNKAICNKWREKNPEKIAETSSRWRSAHKEKVLGYYKTYGAKRRRDLQQGISARISRAIHHSIHEKKSGRHWESLVDFTLEQLMNHIEKQFLPGMSWKDRSEWHIDHIVPQSAFNFEKPEDIDFKRCWSLKNLQPLWTVENIKKGGRLSKPFQPSLLLGGIL